VNQELDLLQHCSIKLEAQSRRKSSLMSKKNEINGSFKETEIVLKKKNGLLIS